MNNRKIIEKIFNKKPTIAEIFLDKTSLIYLDKKDYKEWPQEWKKINFKLYPRFKKILLNKNIQEKDQFFKFFLKRRSQREFTQRLISKKELSLLLLYSSGIIKKEKDWSETKRTYPSAGARYPLEMYPIIFSASDLKPGIYHYDVKNHALELILRGNHKKEILKSTGQDLIKNSSLIILISAVFGRTMIKYKERGLRYIFIEAGHLGQNISLVTEKLGLGSCAIGGFLDKEINKLLDIDSQKESVIYIFAIGYPK